MHQEIYSVRMVAVLLGLYLGFGALTLHLYRIQVVRHQELYEKARVKYTASRKEKGERGLIFDVHGNLLAGNLACRDVLAEPRHFQKDRGLLFPLLRQKFDLDQRTLNEKIAPALQPRNSRVEVVLARGIDIKVADDMARDFRNLGIRGLRFADSYRRYYPKNDLMANMIGFIDNDGNGVTGIEKQFDARLKPTQTEESYERDRLGYQIRPEKNVAPRPRNGVNLYVTIDETIQQIVEEELRGMVETFQPAAAYAVMVNPKTGAVMAMAQYPTFNLNNRKKMNPRNWQNRILIEGFEPGSIMKACAITGALDGGVVSLDTTINCEQGRWFYAGRSLRDSGHKYGVMQVRSIVQKSSNIGTAKIALLMGEQRLFDTLTIFGFGKATGIELPDEATGIYRPLKQWDGLSITRFPIGQGILVTPLQMVQAYSAIANQGKMYQLMVIDRIEDPETGLFEVTQPRLKVQVAKPEAVQKIVSALKLVTQEGGTAPKAAVEGYEVAGKTGTAQKYLNGAYSNTKFISNFIGFVPADNPAFVLLVVADEPSKSGYYGGTVAAPTFSRIATKTLRYLSVAPAKPPSRPSNNSGEELPHEDQSPAVTSIP